MKKIILLLLTIVLVSSCNSDDDTISNEVFGNWILTSMHGSIPNSLVTGAAMEWQESYLLNTDGSFVKVRQRDGVTTEATGTFVISITQDGRTLTLTFDTDNDIIASCSYLVEYMVFQSESSFNSTWEICDGAGLTYKKTNQF
ncbi:lipoprotein [uncultured Kordia sp.]|uniref:lipoprotein n=1 Tax=uncultured Kordia sp. TaxID=507699 RepID=UPI0026163E8D|nr:lipoprotein [uncultured Kordia sp.]